MSARDLAMLVSGSFIGVSLTLALVTFVVIWRAVRRARASDWDLASPSERDQTAISTWLRNSSGDLELVAFRTLGEDEGLRDITIVGGSGYWKREIEGR